MTQQEQIEFEARRVAVAFGVSELYIGTAYLYEGSYQVLCASLDGKLGCGFVSDEDGRYALFNILLYSSNRRLAIQIYLPRSDVDTTGELDIEMAHGLCRLGFEEEGVLSQLPELSAHEKMELRLSMPREFWPAKWLEERSNA